MEQIPINMNISSLLLSLCRTLIWNIRPKGFLSYFFFCLHSLLWSCVSSSNPESSLSNSSSNPESLKPSLNSVQRSVKLCKEEVIMIMEKLGMKVELDGDGIEEFGEEEVAKVLDMEPSLAEVEEAFNVFDENKDGFIEAKELQRVLCILGLEKDLKQCERMIDVFDQNGDGLIDHNDFVKLMEHSFG